jgi:hypothetical protein
VHFSSDFAMMKPRGNRMSNDREPEVPVTNEPPKTAEIGAEERARRKAAIDYARGSVRLEGFVPSSYSDELDRRYIDGEITREEKTALLLAHHER